MVVSQLRGTFVAAATYGLWGLLTLYWKQLQGLDALELIGARITLTALLLAVALGVTHQWSGLIAAFGSSHLLARLLLASLLISANWMTYVWAVGHDRVVETALGYFLAPLVTMVLGIVVFHKPSRPAQRAAIAFGAAAFLVLVGAYGRVPFVAIVLAATFSCYSVLKRQIPLSPVQSLAGETFLIGPPAAAFVALAALRGDLFAGASTAQLGYVAFAGVITAVPLLLFAVVARHVPFTILGPISYLVPTINFLLGIVVFDEPFDVARLIGFALVWVGLVLIAVDAVRTGRQPDRPSTAAAPAVTS